MDNAQPTTWLGAAIATATTVWQAFVVPTGVAAWAVWRWQASRKDTREKAEQDENAKLRDGLDARQVAHMDWQDAEIVRLRALVIEVEGAARKREAELEAEIRQRERDREIEVNHWRGLARTWFNAAHDTFHAANGLLFDASARLLRAGQAMLEPNLLPKLSTDLEKP